MIDGCLLANRLIALWLSCVLVLFAAASVAVAAQPTTNPSAARTIILVRHGAYDLHSSDHSDDGPGLSPLGIAQARLVGARLRGGPSTIAMLTTSTMTRALETAAVIHQSLPTTPVQRSNQIRECTPPTRDEKDVREERRKEEAACQATLEEVFKQFLIPAQGSEETDVWVCHGNVIRYLVTRALGVDTRPWTRMAVAHASVTVIRVRPDGSMAVLSVGDVGHLPSNLQSWGSDSDQVLAVPSFEPKVHNSPAPIRTGET